MGDVVTELLKNNDASVVLPRAVRKFVAWFDAGAYTELPFLHSEARRAEALVALQRGQRSGLTSRAC